MQDITKDYIIAIVDAVNTASTNSAEQKKAIKSIKETTEALLKDAGVTLLALDTPESKPAIGRINGKDCPILFVKRDKYINRDTYYVSYSIDGENDLLDGNFDDPFPYGEILMSIYDALKYYRTNDIPKSDWGGENDITRGLSKLKNLPTIERIIIPDMGTTVLGAKTTINTTLEVRPYGLELWSFVFFDGKNGWLQTVRLSPDLETSLAVKYHFAVRLGVYSVANIAKLITHFNIPLSDDATMLHSLLNVIEKKAQDKGSKWVYDFCTIFEELGISYSFGPAFEDWPEDYRFISFDDESDEDCFNFNSDDEDDA